MINGGVMVSRDTVVTGDWRTIKREHGCSSDGAAVPVVGRSSSVLGAQLRE